MRAINQTRDLGLLAGSVLLVVGALLWIAFGSSPVRAESGSSAPVDVQDKPSEALKLKLLMHRFGTSEPRLP